MSDLKNEFPNKISRYFVYKNEVYPRGGILNTDRGIVLIGATMNYAIGLTQIRNDLAIIKIPSLDNYIPLVPRVNISTVDDLLIYAYKAIFSPFYGVIMRNNKVLTVGVIYSRDISNKRASYWIYDPQDNSIHRVDIGNIETIVINYTEIPDEDLNKMILRIFNVNGLKEQLKRFIEYGLFTLDSDGE